MSATQGILDQPAPSPTGPPPLTPALREVMGDYHTEVVPIATRMVAAGIRFARTRGLEVTVWGLLIAWWFVLASLVLRFMPLATIP
jgi:hypothetical protein